MIMVIAKGKNMYNIKSKKTTYTERVLTEFFRKNKGQHFTAKQVYFEILTVLPDISQSSIYRTLKSLEQKRLIQKMLGSNAIFIYEMTDGVKHDHIICSRCSKTTALYNNKINHVLSDLTITNDLEVISHSLNIYVSCLGGNCPLKNGS